MRKLMVKLRPNQCPICEGTLSLTEIEQNTFPLDDNGALENYFEQNAYEAFLKCDNCNHIFEADKKGNFFYIRRSLPEVKKDRKNILSFNPFLKY